MKAAVIYVLIFVTHLICGSMESYALTKNCKSPFPVGSRAIVQHHSDGIEAGTAPVLKKNDGNEGLPDYLIFVEDEDDDQDIAKKSTSLLSNFLSWSYSPKLPCLPGQNFSSEYHQSYSRCCKYITQRSLRI